MRRTVLCAQSFERHRRILAHTLGPAWPADTPLSSIGEDIDCGDERECTTCQNGKLDLQAEDGKVGKFRGSINSIMMAGSP